MCCVSLMLLARIYMVIQLYITYSQHYTTASIYTIYIPDTLFHTVWIYIRFIFLRVSAAFIRVLSKFIRAYINEASKCSYYGVYTCFFSFSPSFSFNASALHSRYMIILRVAETSIKRTTWKVRFTISLAFPLFTHSNYNLIYLILYCVLHIWGFLLFYYYRFLATLDCRVLY